MRFIVRDEKVRQKALQAVSGAHLKPTMEVIVREYKKKRSLEQNSRMWALYRDISQKWGEASGEWRSAEVWHEYLKKLFLGTEAVEIKGQVIEVTRSTPDLSTAEMSAYLETIEFWAQSELGIELGGTYLEQKYGQA